MTKHSHKTQKSQVKLRDFVVVTFADDIDQAKDYEALLKSNEIPAMIKEEQNPNDATTSGIAIVVPEDFVDEAHVIIESQDAYDDFYDLAMDDDIDDFDDDLLDDYL